jgi:hypothetical protein
MITGMCCYRRLNIASVVVTTGDKVIAGVMELMKIRNNDTGNNLLAATMRRRKHTSGVFNTGEQLIADVNDIKLKISP